MNLAISSYQFSKKIKLQKLIEKQKNNQWQITAAYDNFFKNLLGTLSKRKIFWIKEVSTSKRDR